MSCPYLEEVVMVFCRAYPAIKKPIPRSRSLTSSPCVNGGFERCPIFNEMTVTSATDTATAAAPRAATKEVSA
jgi:hypothetical protein